ncbi:SirB2 family protein [Thiolapillus sp.]
MIDHDLVKLIHISCVVLSLIGFTLRSILMLMGSPLLRRSWVRTVPHLVDSTLFFSGLWLAWNLHQYPGTTPWLTAKLSALIAYIVFGALALRGRTRRRRYLSLVAAYACFAYMVAVALTRSPVPGL